MTEIVYVVARKKPNGELPKACEVLERRFFFVLQSAQSYANTVNQQPRQIKPVVVYRVHMIMREPVRGR